ncbi:MAG: hypothetical protein IPG46_16800 [Actinobacteria bacterium]|nr:hypothetical protein [Actinomycetota bacterium]
MDAGFSIKGSDPPREGDHDRDRGGGFDVWAVCQGVERRSQRRRLTVEPLPKRQVR